MNKKAVGFVVVVLLLTTGMQVEAAPGWLDMLFGAGQQAQGQEAEDENAASGVSVAGLAEDDIAAGLKEALASGTSTAIEFLGKKDGFWGNDEARIPLPDAVSRMVRLAEMAGQGDKVEAFQLSMNRAAEKAVPEVVDIFAESIRSMTVEDARGILTGGEHAATEFFRQTAGETIIERMLPIVADATDSVGVTRYYKSLTGSEQGRAVGDALSRLRGDDDEASLDLDHYVTQQATNSLFNEIAHQEAAIRKDPLKQTSSLLKRVFGN